MAAALLLGTVGVSAMAATIENFELAVPVGVRAGHGVVPAARSLEWQVVREAVVRSNRERAVAGLDPRLDAEMIDETKVQALLQGLSALAAEALDPIAGKLVYLNHAGLLVGTAQPTHAPAFRTIRGFTLEGPTGNLARLNVDVEIDCPKAAANATMARAASDRFDDEVEALAVSGTASVLSAARTRRFRAAQAWLINARHARDCHPGDERIAAELASAEAATKQYLVAPQGGGMPAD